MSWNIQSAGKARDVYHEIKNTEHVPDEIKELVKRCVGDRHGSPHLNGMKVESSGHIDKSGGSVTLSIQWLPLAKEAPPAEPVPEVAKETFPQPKSEPSKDAAPESEKTAPLGAS